jgi:hypothetical protein
VGFVGAKEGAFALPRIPCRLYAFPHFSTSFSLSTHKRRSIRRKIPEGEAFFDPEKIVMLRSVNSFVPLTLGGLDRFDRPWDKATKSTGAPGNAQKPSSSNNFMERGVFWLQILLLYLSSLRYCPYNGHACPSIASISFNIPSQ